MTLLRSLVFLVWFYVTMAVMGLSYMIPVLRGHDEKIWVAMRGWAKLTVWGLRTICGVHLRIEGREHAPQGAALIASKHQATLDTLLPVLFLSEPVFVVKRELTNAPIFGFYMARGMIPVDRAAHAKALKDMLRAARGVIAKGRQVVIYPEGTRQKIDAPPDYKPGIAALYRDLNLPVTPVALNTGLVWPPKGIMRKPGHVVVKILPPLPAGLPRDEFMRLLEERIEGEGQALLPPHLRRVAP